MPGLYRFERLQRALWTVARVWARMQPRKRRWLIWALVVLTFGWLINAAGCGRPSGPPKPSDAEVDQSAGNRQVAQQLASLRDAAAAAPGVQVTNPVLHLTARWDPASQRASLLSGSDLRVTDTDGGVWQKAGSCFKRVASTVAPAMADVLLPLAATDASFDAPRPAGDNTTQTMRFTASKMGSYEQGAGTVTISDGQISAFSYHPHNLPSDQTFKVTYPSVEIKPPRPECS